MGATEEPEVSDTRTRKSAWRRFVEVAVPVAVFAVAAPFVVNGLASAVSDLGSDSASTPTDDSAATTVPDSTSTTPAVTETTIPIPGLDPNADQQTADLAAQIVAGATPTPAGSVTGAVVDGSTEAPTTTAAGTHSHGVVTPEQPLSRGERQELSAQLTLARAAAEKYPTVADALADGYTIVTGYVPLIGAHYIKWSLMDGNFDVNTPEMLLYDGSDPDSTIVGLSYYLFSDTEPSPFAGPNDHWHQHIGLCIKNGVVVGGEQMSPEDCAARGGAKANTSNGWMVHAWVVPGWESPQGVFSPEHSGLTPDLPNS